MTRREPQTRGDRTTIIGVGGRGSLDQARPLFGQSRRGVEQLQCYQVSADPDGNSGRAGGAGERPDERGKVDRFALVDVVQRSRRRMNRCAGSGCTAMQEPRRGPP
jgi:hypothetical protein